MTPDSQDDPDLPSSANLPGELAEVLKKAADSNESMLHDTLEDALTRWPSHRVEIEDWIG